MPLSILAASMALFISACQPPASENASDSSKKSASNKWSCHIQDRPFAYSSCYIDQSILNTGSHELQLFWQDNNGQTLLTFERILNTLAPSQTLHFATNAGMYNEEFAPIGYTVIEGEEIRALNLNEGGGNFHLLPNGVMWWDWSGNVQITESQALEGQLKRAQAKPWFATQSGPMLVIDGQIHPEFNPDSRSLKFRNGAGVCDDGRIRLVNSEEPVNFYEFAALFKDDLQCPNALFLDGGIASALYAPSINKHDKKEMGVMIGMVANE